MHQHQQGVAVQWLRRPKRNCLRLKWRISQLFVLSIGIASPLLLAASNGYGQGNEQTRISLNCKNLPIQKVFAAIEEKADVVIMYENTEEMKRARISISVTNMKVGDILLQILKGKSIEWTSRGNVIRLVRKQSGSSLNADDIQNPAIGLNNGESMQVFTGKIVDSTGDPIPGASFSIRGSDKKGAADKAGRFFVPALTPSDVLLLSSVGYYTLTVPIADLLKANTGQFISFRNGKAQRNTTTEFTFFLSREEKEMDEVVVSTGMFDRRKETFTGVTRTYSGKEVRTASRQNVLEALNLLDPSLKIIRNDNLGSNPNQLPKIEMRGSRTVNPPTPEKYSQQLKLQYEKDPNQPLFILDGFETDLGTVVNLDVNRIASITLLKDAASTALYGSRSANGVVVIQTVRPAAGKLQVSYTATTTLVMPDLSGYNMMNSEELLKFQEFTSAGKDAPGPFAINDEYTDRVLVEEKRAYRQNAMLQGVNSNWLKVPLQQAGTLNHILSVSGGDTYFTYVAGLSKNGTKGVMKGSENSNTSGFLTLLYRQGKFNASNDLTINGKKQSEGPYGSFSGYVKMPPYYVVNNKPRYLEEHVTNYFREGGFPMSSSFRFSNPLYNAGLPYKNAISGLSVKNNFRANWDVLPFLRVTGSLLYSKTSDHSDYFISPLNTMFDNAETNQKGSYEYNSIRSEMYSGNLMLTYNKVFAGKHIVNMNLRSEFEQTTTETQTISAVGYATTAEPLLYLANSYRPDSKPGGSTIRQTKMSVIGSLNYSYDMRYNLDLSYNLSGTSNFGVDNPYQSFYALGVGWNLSKEAFLIHSKWVDYLNISANIGLTGNQNAGNFGSRSTYVLKNTPSFFGEAVQLMNLGNPDLDWTKTYNVSYNLSGKFFRNKLSLSLAAYTNNTDPLIIALPVSPSVGISEGIARNLGKLTSNGLELIVDARLVNTRDWTLNVGINAPLYYKSKYSGLSDQLDKFNDSARNGGFVQRYYDGASPDDVWAVRSLGIGQARGMEVFLDKYGAYTYAFDKNNEVVIGSSRPVSQGNFNMRMRYKRFTVSVFCRYVFEEMKFNNALYDKVENLSKPDLEYNQDKRALYTRWQKPGDEASFLGITNTTLGLSSRFLQKENALYVENINFNYDVLDQYSKGAKAYIRKKLGLQAFNFGVTTSNIFQFQLSNIKRERGFDYPFNRSITLHVNLIF